MKALHLLLFALLLTAIGCNPAASIVWSPDGTRAVYAVQNLKTESLLSPALLIDSDGKTIADLGPIGGSLPVIGAAGPVAWTGDSTGFYFIAEGTGDPAALTADWAKHDLKTPEPSDLPPESKLKMPFVALYKWNAGKPQRLITLGQRFVIDLQLSGDGQWLMLLTTPPDNLKGELFELFAYHTADQHFYRLHRNCGYGLCFTAADRVAFIRGNPETAKTERGQIVETVLADTPNAPKCTALADVLLSKTGWLRPVDDGILFIATPEVFPAVPNGPEANVFLGSLYLWDRRSGELRELAKSVADISLSPDGKRLIYLTGTADKDHRVPGLSLNIMNVDGTHARKLSETTTANLALWPAWHGNNRITRADRPGDAIGNPIGGTRTPFDLVEDEVTADGTTKPTTKILSGDWPDQLKPYWFDDRQLKDIH